jgi:integrase
MRRYYHFHGRRNPAELTGGHVERFLSSLATEGRVSASTQKQAVAALLFLYREVPCCELPWMRDIVRAKTPEKLRVVLSRSEVRAVLAQLHAVPRLMATLLYGSGLRLLECRRLRFKYVDFDRHQITVRRGKGDKDRATLLPASIAPELEAHLARTKARHQRDPGTGAGWVDLPGALARKLPQAGREWPWQWLFPTTSHYVDRARRAAGVRLSYDPSLVLGREAPALGALGDLGVRLGRPGREPFATLQAPGPGRCETVRHLFVHGDSSFCPLH